MCVIYYGCNMDKQKLTRLGAASCAVIVGGVIVSGLLPVIAVKYNEGRVHNITGVYGKIIVPQEVWIFGLVLYIIPGIIGLVAAFVQNKYMYLTTWSCAAISLIIIEIACIGNRLTIANIVFGQWTIPEYCKDADDNCKCRSDQLFHMEEYKPTPFKTCAYFKKFSVVMTVLLFFVGLTWAAEATEFVLACYYYYRSRASAGVVIMPSRQPMLQPGPYMMPQAYGQPRRVVVHQAYVQPGPVMMPQGYGQPGPDMMLQTYNQPGSDTVPQAYGQGYSLPGNV